MHPFWYMGTRCTFYRLPVHHRVTKASFILKTCVFQNQVNPLTIDFRLFSHLTGKQSLTFSWQAPWLLCVDVHTLRSMVSCNSTGQPGSGIPTGCRAEPRKLERRSFDPGRHTSVNCSHCH